MVQENCPKCNGEGYIKSYSHIHSGKCFLCDGFGSIEKRMINENKLKEQHIQEIKDEIRLLHKTIQSSKLKKVNIMRKDTINKLLEDLSKYGVLLSLEEILED